MTESVDRSEERSGDVSRSSESYVRTDGRTDEEPNDPAHNSDRGLRGREDDSDSDSETRPVCHPRDIPAHRRKPEMQRLRAILLTAGAKIPKEVTDDRPQE